MRVPSTNSQQSEDRITYQAAIFYSCTIPASMHARKVSSVKFDIVVLFNIESDTLVSSAFTS